MKPQDVVVQKLPLFQMKLFLRTTNTEVSM